jgi:stress response protein YsnF
VPGQAVSVRLDSGERLRLAPDLVGPGPDGALVARVAFADATRVAASGTFGGETFQEIQERLNVTRVLREVERARVSVRTGTTEETITEDAWREAVEVRRIPVDEIVHQVEDVRTDGNETIIPIYEEIVVVERRLVLRERLHVTLRREETRIPQRVVLRHQFVEVERLPTGPAPGASERPSHL